MLILPTKGRPLNLKRFISHYYETKATLPIWVIFDADDADNYENIGLPEGWKRICAPAGTKLGDIYNMIFRDFPNEEYYGFISDDCIPETEEWDIKLKDACLPDKIVWSADGNVDDKIPTFPFFGGELIRKLGFWSPGDMKHWYTDNAWNDIALALDKRVYIPEIMIRHLHPALGNAKDDSTYANQPNHSVDKVSYESWKRFDFPLLLERLNAV